MKESEDMTKDRKLMAGEKGIAAKCNVPYWMVPDCQELKAA